MFKTLSAFNKNQGPLTKNFVWENFEDGSKMTADASDNLDESLENGVKFKKPVLKAYIAT